MEKEARLSNSSTLDFTPNEKGEEFFNLFKQNQLVPLKDMLAQHISLAEQWATTDKKEGREVLWSSEDGRPIYQKLSEILDYANILENVEKTIVYKLDELRSFKISPIRNNNEVKVINDTAIKNEIENNKENNITKEDLEDEISKTMYLKNLKENIVPFWEEKFLML